MRIEWENFVKTGVRSMQLNVYQISHLAVMILDCRDFRTYCFKLPLSPTLTISIQSCENHLRTASMNSFLCVDIV